MIGCKQNDPKTTDINNEKEINSISNTYGKAVYGKSEYKDIK